MTKRVLILSYHSVFEVIISLKPQENDYDRFIDAQTCALQVSSAIIETMQKLKHGNPEILGTMFQLPKKKL